MRILLVSNYFPEHIGGIETVAGNLARGYRRRGHRVIWAAADAGSSARRGHDDDLALPAWNVTEDHLGFPYPVLAPSAYGRLLSAVRGVDVAHVHDCLYQASAFTVIAASMLRRPVLLTQHVGIVPYRQPALRLAQQLAYRGPGRLVLSRANQLSFISRPVADWFSGLTRRARSAPVIPNGVDTSLFRPLPGPARAALRNELQLPKTGPILLFCGRFVEKKGLHLLGPVARRNSAWTWLFVGRPGDVDPGLWGLPNVRSLGSMAPSRLASYYQVADMLTLPSTGEGFPVAVQEGMACGTPAVISDEFGRSLPPSIAFATARTSDAIERTVSRALEVMGADPGLRERVAAYAHQQWDWEAAIDRYAALLTAITAGQQGARRDAVARS